MILLASPKDWGGHRTEGSADDVCSECGTEVTLAPTSQIAQYEHNVTVYCVPCGLIRMENDKAVGEKVEFSTLPGQMEEIEAEIERMDCDE